MGAILGKLLETTGDERADIWRHLNQANKHLANAHHTSRNVPHTGDLAAAIASGREAEELVMRWANLGFDDKLAIYGPRTEVYVPEAHSPLEMRNEIL